MTALATSPVTREGAGWQMEILPESFLLHLRAHDETAMKRALEDLASWSNLVEWSGGLVHVSPLGDELWLFLWEPAVTSW